uniref:RNA-directed DNA polymerase n=1 Tax=Lygus hesperus TaxID=30085 RepID=A0A0A9YZ15_LYGHE
MFTAKCDEVAGSSTLDRTKLFVPDAMDSGRDNTFQQTNSHSNNYANEPNNTAADLARIRTPHLSPKRTSLNFVVMRATDAVQLDTTSVTAHELNRQFRHRTTRIWLHRATDRSHWLHCETRNDESTSAQVLREEYLLTQGLGNGLVVSPRQILTDVTVDGLDLKINFHQVEDIEIPHSIILGSDLLEQNVSITLAKNSCTLVPVDLQLSKSLQKKIEKLNKNEPVKSILDSKDKILELNSNQSTSDEHTDQCPSLVENDVSTDNNMIVGNLEVNRDVFDPHSVQSEISNANKPRLYSILSKYSEFFTSGFPKTRMNNVEFRIRLKDPGKIVNRKPYPMSNVQKQYLREHLAELEAAGLIRRSQSPFASPILLVPKKNQKMRLAVDYRFLNENTISEHQPLPLIQDQINRLVGSKFYSVLDTASGFHQIKMHPDSIDKTAFVTPEAQWEYLVCPFGVRNASSTFQRAILEILGDLAHQYVICFLDDLMITATTEEEALDRLDHVLAVLTQAGVSLNHTKCHFVVTHVEFLGYNVQNGELRPNTLKIDALVALPPPSTVTSLRQFLGLASYFRSFIPKFSEIAAPLYRLLSSKGKLIWNDIHENARQTLIKYLTSEPVLTIFDPSLPVELHCDACSIGVSGILINLYNGKPRVVAYFSKKNNSAEQKYHSYDLETMAVVKSLLHFKTMLQDISFSVVTDCKSLKDSFLKQTLNTRVHRWWSFMQTFDFKIQYRPAGRMQHADYLSRHPLDDDGNHIVLSNVNESVPKSGQKEVLTPVLPHKVRLNNEKSVSLGTLSNDWLLLAQQSDSELAELAVKCKNHELPDSIRNTYELRSGVLCRIIQRGHKTRTLPIIPRLHRYAIIQNIHESVMHLGYEKTLEKAADFYWFEGMARYVKKFCDNCLTCKVAKTQSGKRQVSLHPIPKGTVPWSVIHVDVSGKLSGKGIARNIV